MKTSKESAKGDFPGLYDDFYTCIKEHAGGCTLYAVLALSALTALNSFWMGWQLQLGDAQDVAGSDLAYTENSRCDHPVIATTPIWQSLLHVEIGILSNLIHAALLAVAALVLLYRGDVVWLYFCKNLCFFWTINALVYLGLDVVSFHAVDTSSQDDAFIRLGMTGTVAILAGFGCVQYNRAACVLHGLAFRCDRSLAVRVIECGSVALQIAYVLYYGTTAGRLAMLQSATCNDTTRRMMLPLFQTYVESAHAAFLLALFQQAFIYPEDCACVGGAILSATWRSGVSIVSLWNAVAGDTWSIYSLIFTAAEAATVLPALAASLWLLFEQNPLPKNEYDPVEEAVGKATFAVVDGCVETVEERDVHYPSDIEKVHCVSLAHIAASEAYSRRQRSGAWALSIGSTGLLVEMTLECVLLLSRTTVGSDASHDVYKWGMHSGIMYIFCTCMAVETPHMYSYARPLLALACPAGSLIAVWQLYTLLGGLEDSQDLWTMATFFLFVCRVGCGVVQTMGILLLKDTTTSMKAVIQVDSAKPDECAAMEARWLTARRALFTIFMPVFALYVLTSAYYGNCYDPMISTALSTQNKESCISTNIVLAPNWLGLGLFFHFGVVLLLFAYDGLRRGRPSYIPSLLMATVSASHVSVLMLFDLIWDVASAETWHSVSAKGVICRVLLLFWMLASGNLALSLYRFSKMKIVAC